MGPGHGKRVKAPRNKAVSVQTKFKNWKDEAEKIHQGMMERAGLHLLEEDSPLSGDGGEMTPTRN